MAKDIVTVYYTTGGNNAALDELALLWAHQVSVYAPGRRVTIYTTGMAPALVARLSAKLPGLEVVTVALSEKAGHPNIALKLANYLIHPRPFVGIDLDAILFGPIDALDETPTGIDLQMCLHGNIPGHTDHISYALPQGGVQCWHRPQCLTLYDALIYPARRGCPGIEQPIIEAIIRCGAVTFSALPMMYNTWGGHDGIVYKAKDGRVYAEHNGQPVAIVHYWSDAKAKLIASLDALAAATGYRNTS